MTGKISFVYFVLMLGVCCMVCDSQTTSGDCNTADGVASWMGDGTCDPQNLMLECEWDGGDCCICTCDDDDDDNKYACGTDGYLCLDSTVLGNDTCGEESLPACPVDDQYFVVGNTTDVQDLVATMSNCSGGTFHVECRDNIMVDTDIVVSYGTFLNVTGVGSSTVLDGGGGTRIFRVVNASLQINSVQVRNGNATFGGAIEAINSNLTMHRTSFVNNTAYDKNGGAIFLYGSNVSFSGQTDFFNNSADYGGALYAARNSSVLWEGVSNFIGNSAYHSGGALGVVIDSKVIWEAETTFEGNDAATYSGGAVFLEGGSSASWDEEANFIANSARLEGGAVFIDIGSSALWRGSTMFSNNSVRFEGGGAILIADFSTVELRGETKFESNSCRTEGGAVSSKVLDSSISTSSGNQEYSLLLTGSTTFSNNQCGSNGGGVALLSGLSASFESRNITFVGNAATLAGGGVFLSTTGEGPDFSNTTFISNSAEVGGGVYISGAGTSLDDESSATFDNCTFSGNEAAATGGAIEIASGVVTIANTVFKGNKANVGGALWLAGAASLENCLFEENVSDEDGGQAITTIVSDFEILTCNFRDNLYDCDTGSYLDESEPGIRFDAVCQDCDGCDTCGVENNGTKPTCTTALEHTKSSGGTNATLQTLRIDRGYWRATNDSVNILACYNEDACVGGMTNSPDYCQMGYKGPYCSVCIDNYAKGMGFTCTKCSENIWGIVAAVTTLVISVLIAFTAVKYVMSVEKATRPGIIARIFRRVPLQSVKIVIVAWQILTQFTTVADVTFPDLYQRFLNVVDIFNFDLTWMISASCFIPINFHGQLLILTIGPIAVMLFLGGTYTYVKRKHHASEESLRIVRHKHVSIILLIMFLVYSSTSSVVFQTFDCELLDDDKDYLRADYTIECDSPKHRALMIYAGFMLLLYPLGIPAFFAYLLFQNRKVLTDEANREEALNVRSISHLWKPYRPSRFYFEVIECCRRIILTGAVLLVDDDSAAQIAVTLILAFVFTVVSEGLAPYESQLDAWVSRLGHAVVVATMYYALLLKVDVSEESTASQTAFDIVLIVIHVAMILLVIGEAFITTYSLNQGQVEDPWPRFQRYRSPRIYFTTRSMSDVSPRNHESPHSKETGIGGLRPAPLQRGERLRPL